jgi:hypothetical protein
MYEVLFLKTTGESLEGVGFKASTLLAVAQDDTSKNVASSSTMEMIIFISNKI